MVLAGLDCGWWKVANKFPQRLRLLFIFIPAAAVVPLWKQLTMTVIGLWIALMANIMALQIQIQNHSLKKFSSDVNKLLLG